MKNKLFLTAALTVATASGCQKAPQTRAEYSTNPEIGCATFVRESVEETIDLKPGELLQQEIGALDLELRDRIFKACKRYYEITGDYPGMNQKKNSL